LDDKQRLYDKRRGISRFFTIFSSFLRAKHGTRTAPPTYAPIELQTTHACGRGVQRRRTTRTGLLAAGLPSPPLSTHARSFVACLAAAFTRASAANVGPDLLDWLEKLDWWIHCHIVTEIEADNIFLIYCRCSANKFFVLEDNIHALTRRQ
jgi:hypothetical protein